VMTAALAAAYTGAHVAHVEAGLRSHDRHHPFPEELNRRMASVLTSIHFAPTDNARANLLAEGIRPEAILVTGNTVVDAIRTIRADGEFADAGLREIDFERSPVVLVTAHRRENHGTPLRNICLALVELSRRVPDLQLVFPVHPNPRVRELVTAELSGKERIYLCEPLGYLDMVRAMKRCKLVMTDSGGLQEEAPSIGKPVLVFRDVTERPEVIECGAGSLVGTDPKTIVAAAVRILSDETVYRQMTEHRDIYGDGHAGERIADAIVPMLRTLEGASNRSTPTMTPQPTSDAPNP
jgi:UDP-N-acetylglucosamine 2-epimerase (non-hydrolysing)